MVERPTLCARCGSPAEGHAFIGDQRYCHGRNRPSCYEIVSWLPGTPFETAEAAVWWPFGEDDD